MAFLAPDDDAPSSETRVTWFRPVGERPVNGGGNTVFVRPAELPQPSDPEDA